MRSDIHQAVAKVKDCSSPGSKSELDLRAAFAQMITIRVLEERLLDLFSEGKLTGTMHTSIGQEDIAVGVIRALDREHDIVFSNHRCHGHFLAYGGELDGLVKEIMGRESGVCGGRGGSQHLCWRNFYSNGIQGGMVPVACGYALAEKLSGSESVVCVFLGDGTLGEGVVYESFNMAALWHLPILFVIEDNGYAQTTPKALAVTGSIASRTEAFGIPTMAFSAGDVQQVYIAARRCASELRAGNGPQCLALTTYRLAPHSKGDDFRDPEEIRLAWDRDPVGRTAAVLPEEITSACKAEAERRVEKAVQRALQDSEPDPVRALQPQEPPKPIGFRVPPIEGKPRVAARLNEGLHAAFSQNPYVFLIGEDILDPYGGAFKVARGLSFKYPERVITTPISEAAIVGFSTGAAMSGMRPVTEIMFGDFITLITDQVINHATKFRWMYNDQVNVPIVIRTPMGGRRGYGPTHSQSLERIFLGVPGLRVVAITAFWDPAETLLTCLSQDDPVLLLENKVSYTKMLQNPPDGYIIVPPQRPLGSIRIQPENMSPDIIFLTYGGMDIYAVDALIALRREEVVAEIIIAQQISPLDQLLDEIVPRLKISGRLVVCEEGTGPWGFGAEVLAVLHECDDTRHVRARRVAAPSVPVPSSRSLEGTVLPDASSIVGAVVDMYLEEANAVSMNSC